MYDDRAKVYLIAIEAIISEMGRLDITMTDFARRADVKYWRLRRFLLRETRRPRSSLFVGLASLTCITDSVRDKIVQCLEYDRRNGL